MVTDKFDGPHRFLSNFFIEPDGTSVEIEYQRAKCTRDDPMRKQFDGLTPAEAKRLGRKVKLRSDWETVKLLLMQHLVEKKFKDHPKLMDMLKATAPDELVEGNWWGDRFWGEVNGEGENWLGKILMSIRDGQPLL